MRSKLELTISATDDGIEDDDDDDEEGDNVDDADTSDNNEADDDCEITDVVVPDFVTDEYGVIVLDGDNSVGDSGVVCDTGLPTRGCKISNVRVQLNKNKKPSLCTCTVG